MTMKRKKGQKAHDHPLDLLETKAKVAKMLRLRLPQRIIAKECGVSQPMVSQYYTQMRKELVESASKNIEEDRQVAIAFYEEMRAMALKEYHRSSNPRVKVIKEWEPLIEKIEEEDKRGKRKKGKQGDQPGVNRAPLKESLTLIRKIKQTEGRLAASEWMRIVMSTMEMECKLKGLFIEIKLEQNNYEIADWDSMRGIEKPQDPAKLKELELEAKVIPPNKNGVHKKEKE
jgi:hypothetical protein